jgi:hypothetical protein
VERFVLTAEVVLKERKKVIRFKWWCSLWKKAVTRTDLPEDMTVVQAGVSVPAREPDFMLHCHKSCSLARFFLLLEVLCTIR